MGAIVSVARIEQNFISSVLSTASINEALAFDFKPEDFRTYEDEWRWILNFHKKHGKTPDRPTFKTKYPSFALINVRDVGHFGEELRKQLIKRESMDFVESFVELIQDGDLDSAMRHLHGGALRVGAKYGLSNDGDVFTQGEDIWEELAQVLERKDETGNAGIPLGFDSFDRHTGGFKPGELITVGARSGVGKSWILMQGVRSALRADKNVVYNSLEMPRTQLWSRLIPMLSKEGGRVISNIDITRGEFTMSDLRLFMKNVQDNLAASFHIVDRGRGQISPTTIAAQIERLRPDIVFLDYLQLMTRGGDWTAVGAASAELKQIAMHYGIPIVAAVQLNREASALSNKGEPPGLETIANADSIAQDSDTVITIAKPSDRTMKAKIAKNRHGKDGIVFPMHFDPGKGIFRECSYQKMLGIVQEDKLKAQEELLSSQAEGEDEDDDDDFE